MQLFSLFNKVNLWATTEEKEVLYEYFEPTGEMTIDTGVLIHKLSYLEHLQVAKNSFVELDSVVKTALEAWESQYNCLLEELETLNSANNYPEFRNTLLSLAGHQEEKAIAMGYSEFLCGTSLEEALVKAGALNFNPIELREPRKKPKIKNGK